MLIHKLINKFSTRIISILTKKSFQLLFNFKVNKKILMANLLDFNNYYTLSNVET